MLRFSVFRGIGLSGAASAFSLLSRKLATCSPDSDEEEVFKKLMASAQVPARFYPELNEAGVGTAEYLMCVGEGKLGLDPPDANTVHAILAAARNETALSSPEMMPKRDGSNHADSGAANTAAAKAAYQELHKQMTLLCRLSKAALPDLIAKKALAASSPDAAKAAAEKVERERELEDVKHPTAKATLLRAAAYELYNVHLGTARHERRAADDQLVKTHQSLKLHRLSVAALSSTKYGRLTAIDRPQTTLTVSSDASLIASEEHQALGRYSETLQCINACIDSLVEGGIVEIDRTTQIIAAESPHGKLRDGRQVEFNLQAGLALKAAYLALSDCLNGKALALHWAEQFVAVAAGDMQSGHSLASSTMSMMSTSAFRPNEHLPMSLGLAAATPPKAPASHSAVANPDQPSAGSGAPSAAPAKKDDLSKANKRIAHLEREREDMIRAKHARAARAAGYRGGGGPHGGGFNNGGGYQGGGPGGSNYNQTGNYQSNNQNGYRRG